MSASVSVPTDPYVIELSENNAPRTCSGCDGDAEFYLIITDEAAEERLGREFDNGEWLLNKFLCRECFADAERVQSWEELVEDQ